jgi:hypothetical protein
VVGCVAQLAVLALPVFADEMTGPSPRSGVHSTVEARIRRHRAAFPSDDAQREIAVGRLVAASRDRVRREVMALSTPLPAALGQALEAELQAGVGGSVERLARCCQSLQDATAGQLAPSLRRLFAVIRDHGRLVSVATVVDMKSYAARLDALLADMADDPSRPGVLNDGAAITRMVAILADDPLASGLLCNVATDCRTPNVVIDLPVVPLPGLPAQAIHRDVHFSRSVDGAVISSDGAGSLNVGARLAECNHGLRVVFDTGGSGAADLVARRRRVKVHAGLHSRLDGTVTLTLAEDGLSIAPPTVAVRNTLTLRETSFAARTRILRKAGGMVATGVIARRLPEITTRTEHEMQREMCVEITRVMASASRVANASWVNMRDRMQRDLGAAVAFGGTHVAGAARLSLHATVDAASPAFVTGAPPAIPSDGIADRIDLHLNQSVPTQLADLVGGIRLVETDFRELCLEPLGLVPEFDEDFTHGAAPSEIRLATFRPLQISFREGSLGFDVRLDSFTVAGGPVVTRPCRIRAVYAVDYEGGELRMQRMGRPELATGDADLDTALMRVATRFFPLRASATDVTLVNELLSHAGMKLGQLRLAEQWLGISIHYDPARVIREFMP